MAREDPQVHLRIPLGLKDKLEDRARANGRSLNAEIFAMLERAFEHEQTVNDLWVKVEKLEELVRAHDEQLNPLKYDRD